MSSSPIYKKIKNDMVVAVKHQDAFAVKVLRFLKSNLDSAAKDKLADLTDIEVIKVLQKRIKQSKDAEVQFRQGGRADLADQERKEIELISQYLPVQLNREELVQIVERAIAEIGTGEPHNFGRLMKRVMEETAGRSDGKTVKEIIEQALNKKI